MKEDRRQGYRPAESYRAKTKEAKERQLAALKRGRENRKKLSPVQKASTDPFHKSFIKDINKWAGTHFYLKETHNTIKLLKWEIDLLNDVFHGDLKISMALLGMCKKSGKSTLAALAAVWKMCSTENAEIYLIGPDLQQGQLVLFEKIRSAVEMHPVLSKECKVTEDKIYCKRNNSYIMVLPCNQSNAGLSPDMTLFDELWQFTSKNAERAWDEMTNIPTGLKDNLILITTYAGYSNEDDSILWKLYKSGMDQETGKEEKDEWFYFLWRTDYEDIPWVTQKYLDSQRKRLRANSYARFHENQWSDQAEAFVLAQQWDACVDEDFTPPKWNTDLRIVAAIDASVSGDSTAIVALYRDNDKVVLVRDKIIIPSKENPINFETQIENYVIKLAREFSLQLLLYDPYQMVSTAQRLEKKGIRTKPFNQTVENLTKMAGNIYDLIKYKNLVIYAGADDLRSHALNAVSLETVRGYRISKDLSSKKIDGFIALSMAAMAAVERWRWLEDSKEPEFLVVGDSPYLYVVRNPNFKGTPTVRPVDKRKYINVYTGLGVETIRNPDYYKNHVLEFELVRGVPDD